MTPFWTSASFPENCCRGCQAASPGASQPWWNCSLAYRGVATIYYLGIVSTVSIDIYSNTASWRRLITHNCPQLERWEKITKPLSISFSRSEFQIKIVFCVLFSSTQTSQSCGVPPLSVPPSAIFVECAILGPLVAGGCTCLKFPEPPGVSRP